MEQIVQLIKEQSYEKLTNALDAFVTTHSTSTTFIGKYSEETKREFISSLLNNLEQTLSDASDLHKRIRKLSLESVRLCLREEQGSEQISKEKTIDLLVKLCNFNEEYKHFDKYTESEALKCIVNLLVKFKSAIVILNRLNVPEKITKKIKGMKYTDIQVFPICRIIFQMAIDKENAAIYNKYGINNEIIKLIGECWEEYKESKEIATITGELLRVVFTLTMSLGPLENGEPKQPTSQQNEECILLLHLYSNLITIPITIDNYAILSTIVNCLINIPVNLYLNQIPKSTLQNLLNILYFQVNLINNKTERTITPEDMVPTLMLLSIIAKHDKNARNYIREIGIPNYNDDLVVSVEGPKHENIDSLVTKLKPFITSVNPALKYYVQETFFVLCDEDPNQYVRLLGFGNASGLLMERQLFGSMTNSSNNNIPSSSPSSTTTNNTTSNTTINNSTNKNNKNEDINNNDVDNDDDDSYDSQDERDAAELMQKLQRLEELGVVKVMK